MFEEDLPLLVYIGKKTQLVKTAKLSTAEIANDLQFSQQTASRKLIACEQKGYLTRQTFIDGIEIKLLPKARKLLEEHFSLLQSLYQKTPVNSLVGTVKPGLGEGKFYMQIKQYKDAIKEKLQFTPYPGTLNITVDTSARKQFLLHKQVIKIEGFTTKERSFGGIFCYPVLIKKNKNKIKGALILPERTNHPEDVAELIASTYLRQQYNLKDNDTIEVE